MREGHSQELADALNRLNKMKLAELRRVHRARFGSEPTILNAQHLRRKLAWEIQAEAEGGLPESVRQHAMAIARVVELRTRVCGNAARRRAGLPSDEVTTTAVAPLHDSRLPMPGSLLVQEHKGQTIVVKVLDGCFEYDSRRFTSLSAIALEITGTKWNGYLFFGLTKGGSSARQ